jgi:hypothetical protein
MQTTIKKRKEINKIVEQNWRYEDKIHKYRE